MSKKLYTAFSFFGFTWNIFLRLLFLSGLIYCLYSFKQNPAATSIAAVICLLVLIFIGNDQITVYPDKIIHTDNSLASFFSKDKPYFIKDIRRAYLQPLVSDKV